MQSVLQEKSNNPGHVGNLDCYHSDELYLPNVFKFDFNGVSKVNDFKCYAPNAQYRLVRTVMVSLLTVSGLELVIPSLLLLSLPLLTLLLFNVGVVCGFLRPYW